jgi:carbamoyltransferase
VLVERSEDFFELENPASHYPARFMLYVVEVKDGQAGCIPAVTHVDGTARLQTVHREGNERYHELIRRFAVKSGVPVLLNTSFNLKGEPIVCSPEDAYRTFSRSGMDFLVLDRFLIRRKKDRR